MREQPNIRKTLQIHHKHNVADSERRKNLVAKFRGLPPKTLYNMIKDEQDKMERIIKDERKLYRSILRMESRENPEIIDIESLGRLEEKDFMDEEFYNQYKKYRDLIEYLKNVPDALTQSLINEIQERKYDLQQSKKELDDQLEEFQKERRNIEIKDVKRIMAEIDKVREKQGKTEDKEERNRLRLYDEYARGVDTINTLHAPIRRYHSELEELKEDTIQYIKD